MCVQLILNPQHHRIMNYYRIPCFLLFIGVCSLFAIFPSNATPDSPKTNIPQEVCKLLDESEDLRCMGYYEPAIELLQEAQAYYRKNGDEIAALRLYDKILWMAIDTDFDSDAFLERLEEAKKEIQPQLEKHPDLEAIIHMATIQVTWIDDNIERAEEHYQALQDLLKRHPNWDYEAAAASHMSSIYAYCTWNADKCGEMVRHSIDLVNKNGKTTTEKNAHRYRLYPYYNYFNYDNLGIVESWGNKDEEASLKVYQQAFDVLKQGKVYDSLHHVRLVTKIGRIYNYDNNEHDKAIEYYENALNYIPTRMKVVQGEVLKSMGDAYIVQPKDEEAIAYYKKSIAVLESVEPQTDYIRGEYVDMYRSMATSCIKLRRFDEAKNYLLKLEEQPEEVDYRPSWTHATWGFYYENLNELDRAIEAHERSIVAYLEAGVYPGSAYWNLANVALRKKDYLLATQNFHKSLLDDFGDWEDQGFHKNASIDEIVNKGNALNSLSDKLHSYYLYVNTENLWEEHGQDLLDLATLTVQCFEDVRNSFDRESSKRSLLETAYYTYEQAISIYLYLYEQDGKQEDLVKAFEFAEKSKSILLEDALKEENALSFGGVPDSLIEREHALSMEITTLQQDLHLAEKEGGAQKIATAKAVLFETRQKQDALKGILEKNYPKYFKLKYAQTAINLKAIQAQLPEKTAIVEYFEGKNQIFVFTITPNDLKCVAISRSEGYSKELEQFRTLLSNTRSLVNNEVLTQQKYTNQALTFYETFVASALPKTMELERLIIVPDGMLNYIAFEALLYEKPRYNNQQEVNFKQLPYLLNRFSTSYNYSAMMWLNQQTAKDQSNNKEILAMAASYNKEQIHPNANRLGRLQKTREALSDIPGTVEEINLIKESYGGTFLSEIAANEATFKQTASNYGILHLAMHGLVDSEHPDFSSMAFTEDGKGEEDNFLHASEIKQLDLKADLVVLSACETGFGKYQHGEGVVSLGRSFMYAGAPSVVMTLWKINDNSSIHIIRFFYNNLQQGMEKDVALQQAKMKYLNSAIGIASYPAFWAAFVQLGDYKAISIAPKQDENYYSIYGGLAALVLLGGLFYWRGRGKERA